MSISNKILDKVNNQFHLKLMFETFKAFGKENSLFHGAALAYYSVFAMVPLLYLAITIFGVFVGNEVMVGIITTFLEENVGLTDLGGILVLLQDQDFEKSNTFLSILGFVALLISSTAFLTSMRASINVFFEVKPVFSNKRKKILTNIISRGTSLSLMMFMGLTVVVFYFAEVTFLSLTDKMMSDFGMISGGLHFILNNAVPILTNTVIFTFVFKYLHDGIVTWRLARNGAIFTGVLLYLGQILIKYYLTHYFLSSGAGIAGSVIVVLVWMFYTSQIIFLGAKFTKVLGDQTSNPILSKKY
jgi:membrane protein